MPGADDFRQRLIEAVQVRDADRLAELADPGIKLDFGGGGGLEELKRRLNSGDQGQELWRSLEELLQLGCAAGQRGDLIMPWLFAQDLGNIDATAALLVTGEEVPVLKEPRASAERIVHVSWDLVNAVSFEQGAPYQRIALPYGEQGFIASDKLRSVLDYRLLATRKEGQWSIDALVAGD